MNHVPSTVTKSASVVGCWLERRQDPERGWDLDSQQEGLAGREGKQHTLFCPFLSLSPGGDKISEPVLLCSQGPNTFIIREFLVVSDLRASPQGGPLGYTCLALWKGRSSSSLAYRPLPGAQVLGSFLLTPPTSLKHTPPSIECFCPSITSGIWLLTQLPAPLKGPRPGSRTLVNTWIGLRFGEGWGWEGAPMLAQGHLGAF